MKYVNLTISQPQQQFFCVFCVMCLGQYSVPKPWNFIFQLNYWGGVPLEVGMPIPPAPTEQDQGE